MTRPEIVNGVAGQRTAEDALRASERRFRTLFDSMTEGAAIHELIYGADGQTPVDYRLLEVNAAFETQTGIPRAEAAGVLASELYGADEPPFLDVYARVATTGEPIRFDVYFEPMERHFSISAFSPAPGQFATVFRDVTASREVEAALRRSEWLYSQAAAIGEFGYWSRGLDLEQGVWSAQTCRIFGVDPDTFEPTLDNVAQLVHPEDRARFLQTMTRVAQQGGGLDHEYRIVRPDGTERIVHAIAQTRLSDDGLTREMVGSVHDVTHPKKAEQALAWEAGVNAAMADLAQAIIRSASIDDVSLLVLDRAKQLTGSIFGFVGYIDPRTGYLICPTMTRDIWTVCQIAGKDVVFKHFGGLWGWVLQHRKSLLTNDPASDPRSTGTPAGHIPIRRFLSAPALVGDRLVGQVALANPGRDYGPQDLELIERLASLYALDLQRKQAEAALAKQAQELSRSNEELRQFAYIASHDLQEPLRMVSSYVQLLAHRYSGQLDEDADEFIAFAVDGTARMQKLIRGLLQYSRIDYRGKAFSPTDANQVLRAVLSELQPQIEALGARVTVDSLPTVMADAGQLRQVFYNLLSNALKFHGGDPPRVHVSATLHASRVAEDDDVVPAEWVFAVRDNGIGIETQYAQHIFEIFRRLHHPGEYPGTGIGLAMCKKIVERHDGRIWVESQQGNGATFCFTLPATSSET